MSDNQLAKAGALHWPDEKRIDAIWQNGGTGEHYGMKTYRVAAMTTASKRHIQHEVGAYNMAEVLCMFQEWLISQGLSIEAMCELDVSEVK